MQRAKIILSSSSYYSYHSIIRRSHSHHNRRAFAVTCGFLSTKQPSLSSLSLLGTTTSSPTGPKIAFISSLAHQHQHRSNLAQPSQSQLSLLPNHQIIMRHISSTATRNSSANPKGTKQTMPKKSSGFGLSSLLVAGATASTTYAAYYFATVVLFSSVATVNGDANIGNDSEGLLFKAEKKTDDTFGIEYAGFDSYIGMALDDGTGVATKEVKAASAIVVSKALDAAGLEETGILKGVVTTADGDITGGDDVTLHPRHVHRVGLGICPVYGCPYFPLDVHYEEEVKAALAIMRQDSSSDSEESDKSSVSSSGGEDLLKSSGCENAATLTLIGYKGGKLEDQINQDRALALVPYLYHNINGGSDAAAANTKPPVARLIGAFDGHARFGEKVSEYVVKTLPALLGSKLVEHDAAYANNNSSEEESGSDDDEQKKSQEIGKILQDTFLELDATSPAEPSGGCTASAVLQIGTKLYVANAGDSRSFIVVHVPSKDGDGSGEKKDEEAAGTTTIVYGTREDKPHLATERERVEHMGGTVYLPNGFSVTGQGTTRVLYTDPTTGSTSGLAMSRSIGDWDAGSVGVIPDPLIDILDINDIKKKVLEKLNESCNDATDEVEIDPATGESSSSKAPCLSYTEKDVKVFAISATDGLLDYLPEQAIANHIAKGLYGTVKTGGEEGDANEQSAIPLLACEDLIYAAAEGWQEDKGGRYRDDIAIAVADLEVE